jgi:DnaK suppressor protein
VEHVRERLLARRRELTEAIARAGEQGRNSAEVDVGDAADRAVDDTVSDDALHAASADSEMLEQVDDALARLENGTYGKCVICGKTIEPARLEAIPWTPYCLADQEKREAAKGPKETPTL